MYWGGYKKPQRVARGSLLVYVTRVFFAIVFHKLYKLIELLLSFLSKYPFEVIEKNETDFVFSHLLTF
jgi:hypothetical protein